MKNWLTTLFLSVGLLAAGTSHAAVNLPSELGAGFTPSAAAQKVKTGKKALKKKPKKVKKVKPAAMR